MKYTFIGSIVRYLSPHKYMSRIYAQENVSFDKIGGKSRLLNLAYIYSRFINNNGVNQALDTGDESSIAKTLGDLESSIFCHFGWFIYESVSGYPPPR